MRSGRSKLEVGHDAATLTSGEEIFVVDGLVKPTKKLAFSLEGKEHFLLEK